MANRRIYKFSELFDLFTAKFATLTELVDDFNIGSVVRAIGQSVVFFVNFLQVQVDVAFKSFRIDTAEDVDLDNRVGDWLLTRSQASAAQGDIIFSSSDPSDQEFIIPAGTTVSTQEDVYGNTLDYTLDFDLTFPSGSSSVTGSVTCTVNGSVGNVQANKITNITNPISGVDAISNPSALASGAETETDAQLRKRVVNKIIGEQTGNEASVLNAAYSVPGVTYAKVKNNTPSSGEYTLYFSTLDGIVDSALRTKVQIAVDAITTFGIVANYAIPSIVYSTISFDLTVSNILDSTTSANDVVSGAINAVYEFTRISNENTLKISDIIYTAKNVYGVTDISNVKIDGVAANKTVSDFEVIKLTDATKVSVTLV